MVRLQYAMGDYKQAKSFEQRFEKVTRRFTPQSLALAYKVHFKLGQRKTAKNYGAMLVKMYPQSWEAQQYILNELELIEADNLAKRYQLSQADNTQTKVKKRIVKLSPKKVSAEKLTPELAVKSPKPIVPAVIFEKETSKVNLSVSQESPTVIVNNEAEKKTIIKTHTKENHQDKRVVVLELDKTKQEKITKENSVILLAKNEESKTVETKTEVIKEEPRPIKKEKVQNFPDFHVVNKGDTLYNISVKYNIKIKALRKWNKISKNKKLHIKDIIFLENPKSVNQ